MWDGNSTCVILNDGRRDCELQQVSIYVRAYLILQSSRNASLLLFAHNAYGNGQYSVVGVKQKSARIYDIDIIWHI